MDFWPPPVHFRRRSPTIFQNHTSRGIGTLSLGMIECLFAENGTLEGGIESNLNGTVRGAKGDYIRFLTCMRTLSNGAPHHFPKAHALRYRHRTFGNGRMYIRGEWAFRIWSPYGDFKWICGPYACIIEGVPLYFPKHMSWGICTANCRMFGCIFAENGSLDGGIEARFRSNGWGVKDELRYFRPIRVHFRRGSPPIFRKHMPLGIGIENFGMICCIFAENKASEASFSGTGRSAYSYFKWIFDLYRCIFEGGSSPFSERTCPEV